MTFGSQQFGVVFARTMFETIEFSYLGLYVFFVTWYAHGYISVGRAGSGMAAAASVSAWTAYFFSFVWFVMYGILAFGSYYFWSEAYSSAFSASNEDVPFAETVYGVGMISLIVEWIFNKMWSSLFERWQIRRNAKRTWQLWILLGVLVLINVANSLAFAMAIVAEAVAAAVFLGFHGVWLVVALCMMVIVVGYPNSRFARKVMPIKR